MSQAPEQTGDVAQLKQAVLALKKMRAKLDAMERANNEPIAIIGMACTFPGGANDTDSFWRVLRDGVNAVSEVPSNRWNIDEYYDPDPEAPGKTYARHGGFLDRDPALFDAEFFGISTLEAESLDPQQRLLLETAWQALENAGLSPTKLAGTQTGVFMGLSNDDYSKLHLTGDPASINVYSGTGSHFSVAVGRLCYVLGLQGPNFPVDTACSSSLVTAHIACQSLRRGECRFALAGGVNLLLWPEGSVYFSKLRALAADGRSKAFDADADGYVRGEGCGILVLKRLSDAQADGDRILAVIRGSAINHNGKSNGLTAPNGAAQRAVIRAALAQAGIEPHQVSYVEAHGTATSLGDSVELEAVSDVLGAQRAPGDNFAIGTVKTNIGHLEAAAGAAALIKVVLSLQHRQIPAHLHFRKPNPHLPWDALPLRIPTATADWISSGKRIAGVSAFSYSGTNAHILIEEAPEREPVAAGVERPLHLLCVSAKSEAAVREQVCRYAEFLETSKESLANICYTANAGRAHFAYRTVVSAASIEEARAKLRSVVPHELDGKRPRLAAVMSDVSGVGSELYSTQPAFRKAWDECAEAARTILQQPLPAPGEKANSGPGAFAVKYALWQMWRSWGVDPGAVWENGSGEAAACAAGALSLIEALQVAAGAGNGAMKAARPRIPLIHGADGLAQLRQLGYTHFLPIGREAGDWEQILSTLANLYLAGVDIDWSRFDRGYRRSPVALPAYPFQRKRYWPAKRATARPAEAHVMIERSMQSPLVKETIFESEWSARWPLLNDHRVYGTPIVPGALLLTMALSAAGNSGCTIEKVAFLQPLALPDRVQRTVQLVLSPVTGGNASFRIVSWEGQAAWTEHANGAISPLVMRGGGESTLQGLQARCTAPLDVPEFYRTVEEQGLHLGASLRWMEAAWHGQSEALCRLRDARAGDDAEQFRLHPGVIDTSLQLVRAAVALAAGGDVYVPVAVDALRFQGAANAPQWCHTRVRSWTGGTPDTLTADARIFDARGVSLAAIEGIQLKRAPREALLREKAAEAYRLEIGERGSLENLSFRPLTRREPGPGEVEIRVAAGGLNFRDVLNALGMYPGDAGLLGGECAGTIIAVGKGVEGLHPGDLVIASGAGCFASHLTVSAAYVVPKPPPMSFEDAAAIPLAFLTAGYALRNLAAISSTDRVLIHAATGGVGLAAVQWAQRARAEIFATAGSDEKRAFLRELGIRHVMDSRSLDFAAQVRAATGGEGVDVVLNSLAGEFIPQSLGLLRSKGRFIEIGKSGILSSEQVAQLPAGIAYSAFDLGQLAMSNPAGFRAFFVETLELFVKGELRPLPCKVFATGDAEAAFRFMAQARHIGKIVISMAQAPSMAASPAERAEFLSRLAEASVADRREMLISAVREQAIKVKGLAPADGLDARRPLKELGFDSLMAVELRNVLAARFALTLPASLVYDYPTVEALAGYLDEQLFAAPVSSLPRSAENPDVSRILSQIEEVSDADVEERLLRSQLLRVPR